VHHADDEVDDGGLVPGAGGRRIATDGRADNGEDARADDSSDAEGGERDGTEGFAEGVLGALGVRYQFVDGLGSEDLAGQGPVLVGGDALVETIVTAG
jgi:hypothetical protein